MLFPRNLILPNAKFYRSQGTTTTWVLLPSAINRPSSQYRCSTKVWSNTNIIHGNEKKTKLLRGPIVRVIRQSIAKRRHFGNVTVYKVLYGERASLARSVCLIKTYESLIKATIFKLMALCGTLVYDSDNCSTYYFWFALSSGVFCFCVWPSFIGAALSVIKVYCGLSSYG